MTPRKAPPLSDLAERVALVLLVAPAVRLWAAVIDASDLVRWLRRTAQERIWLPPGPWLLLAVVIVAVGFVAGLALAPHLAGPAPFATHPARPADVVLAPLGRPADAGGAGMTCPAGTHIENGVCI